MNILFLFLLFLSSCISITRRDNFFSEIDNYIKKGNVEIAIEKLKNYEKKRKKDFSIKLKLAEAYYTVGLYDEAKKRYLEILEKKELSLVNLRLSYIFEKEKLFEKASEYLIKYLKEENDSEENFHLVSILEKIGKYKEAISVLNKIKEQIEDNVYTEKLFWLYVKSGEKQKAWGTVKDKDYPLLKGYILLLMKNYNEAEKYLSKDNSEISKTLILLINYIKGYKEAFLSKINKLFKK